MRYTLFVKRPDAAYDFSEGDSLDTYMAEAKHLAAKYPSATITVCDRQTDSMLFYRENGIGGETSMTLSGMFD